MSTESLMTTNLNKQALRYASYGLPVVPMNPVRKGRCLCHKGITCERPGKHPKTAHGVKDATTNREQIVAWWTDYPDENVGIAPGRSAGIIVLDIDPRHGGNETLKALEVELGALPETVTAMTGGGGRHLFFKHPPFPVRKDTAGKLFGAGVDVLCDGCIAVAPPSRHASGQRYAWVKGKSFKDLTPAKLPRSWRERLGDGSSNRALKSDLVQATNPITEGGRNSHLTSQAGSLQRVGLSRKAILAALNAENVSKCSPPLDAPEVKKIVASITKYPICNGGDAAETLMQQVLRSSFAGGKHLILGTDGRFWHFDDRLWRSVADQWVSGKILEVIQHNPVKNQKTAALLHQVITLIKAKLAVKDDVLAFVADPRPVINCANGELWIAEDGSVSLQDHRPESYLRHCLDVAYDPNAQCPNYDRAVLEIFGAAANPKAMARHWNELVGYLIQSRRNIPAILVLLGRGANGKTALIRTVIQLLGSQLVQSQRIEDLEKSRFAIGSLFGKLLLVDDDVRAGARLPDGILKTISEAKEVTGELKFGPAFNFVARTVPVLLCNNVPSLADLSYGMRRRLMVIPFDRTFTEETRNPDLFERIWKNELPGVLNRALAGYQRLMRRGSKFKQPSPVKAATKRWLEQANPLPAFIKARCVQKAKASCLMGDFYVAYADWTKRMGYTMTQTQQTVGRNLEHLGFGGKKGNRGKLIIGLTLNDSGAGE
jgi:putative DNA primase/helicase